MDIRDFQGLTKFKIFLPSLYVFSWIIMLLGPVLFEVTYLKYCMGIIIYMNVKIFYMFCIAVYILYRSHSLFKRAKGIEPINIDVQREQLDASQQIYYGFILPNFKEDIEMMAQTLDLLASHKRAKQRYLIFLAMQAHEEGCQLKAEELIERFKQKFRLITYTRHELRKYEQKGKASNVSWCAEHLEPIFAENKIEEDQVFLTIVDADSWAPDLYIDVVEEQIIKNYHRRYTIMFQPPQIFTRNHLSVPIASRVMDLMHSYLQFSNLFSFFGLTFPISNYTLSFNLAKRIGYWDTCPEAIGEDFHTAQKAFWKTQGQFKAIPIYVPFNQVNISTGNGYFEDMVARFWQAERHAQGCNDLAWNFKNFFKTKFRPINIVMFLQVFQTFTLAAILPWVLISMILQDQIMYFGSIRNIDSIGPLTFPILFNLMSAFSTAGYLMFEYFKRRSNTLIYHQKNESLLRLLEYPILFTLNLFMLLVPTFVIASFMSLTGKSQYIVAEKKNTSRS